MLVLTRTRESHVVVVATELPVVNVDPAVKDTGLVAMTRILAKVNVTRPLSKTECEEIM